MENNVDRIAVLLMAYGTPNSLDEIEPYYTDIRGGRKPSPEDLRELVARYQRVGGRTPLLDITRAQARALQTELGDQFRVYVGMKHWHPYVAEAVDEIARDGLRRVIALALAPHYSRLGIDGYVRRVRDAVQKSNVNPVHLEGVQGGTPSRCTGSFDVVYVESWNDHPLYLRAVAEKMQAAQQAFGVNDWDEIEVVFSAHSLPERILQSNDPYPRELRETCQGVAALIGLKGWRFAYQSAGRPNEIAPKWLGPDILETLDQIAADRAEGHRRVLIVPIGFVADHLEILYDIDVECAEQARALGLEMRRTESLNASPVFVSALAAIVREYQVADSS